MNNLSLKEKKQSPSYDDQIYTEDQFEYGRYRDQDGSEKSVKMLRDPSMLGEGGTSISKDQRSKSHL